MLQPNIVKLSTKAPYSLMLTYSTGETRLFDVSPYISGSWYGKLSEAGYFRAVRVLPDGGGIEWPDGQDIAPHELYENSIPVA